MPDAIRRYSDPRHASLGERVIIDAKKVPSNLVPFDAYDTMRLNLGIADGSRDMVIEKSTLADGNFDFVNGVSWTKGCYLGQELTARMHYRALIKKRLYALEMKGVAAPTGALIKWGDEDIGELRSSNAQYGVGFLSVVHADKILDKGASLTIEGGTGSLLRPFWLDKT